MSTTLSQQLDEYLAGWMLRVPSWRGQSEIDWQARASVLSRSGRCDPEICTEVIQD